MRRCSAIALAILLLAIPSSPKDKKKSSLPAAILRAQFVAVIVDPDAGIPLMSPGENETARSDVEAALEKWGRFKTTLNTANSDLILVVRKGGKPIKPAIGGVPNEPPVVVNPDDSGITIRGQRGTPPDLSASGTERNGTPTMRSEISSQTTCWRFISVALIIRWIHLRCGDIRPAIVCSIQPFPPLKSCVKPLRIQRKRNHKTRRRQSQIKVTHSRRIA